MQSAISDYALIGDTHTTALISREGAIDFLCWPRHDSPAVFLRLLDAHKGGSCAISLHGLEATKRRYIPETNILETCFSTSSGNGTLTDFMPVHPPETLPEEGPDGHNESRIIRILHCDTGTIEGHFTVNPSFDYARREILPIRNTARAVYFEQDEHRLNITSSHDIVIADAALKIDFSLRAGEDVFLVLTYDGTDEIVPIDELGAAQKRFVTTRAYWRGWSARCTYKGPYRDAVLRSILCLKLLTYSPTGAIIAAPTTSLPEATPGNRNFDYRYTWVRDASFTVTSFVGLGFEREAAEYLRFLRQVDGTNGSDLQLMYAIDGRVAQEETLDHLAGWQGNKPVRIGNNALSQVQHDIYGEVLLALHSYLEAVNYNPPQPTNDRLPETLRNLAERAIKARNEPDQGIWELRDNPQHFVHTKALLWVAIDCAARIGRRIKGLDDDLLTGWEQTAAAIKADFLHRGWSEQKASYMQAFGSTALDASILRAALFGAIPADRRLQTTVDAITKDLGHGDLVYRYIAPDGFTGIEATFTACAFWRVGCLALLGQMQTANETFARLLARANDVGLFAEEIDVQTGEQRGNFPQAFTHMALINQALRLQRLTNPDHQPASE